MDKNDGKALYQAGQCFIKKGEKDRGQAMCDKAIELDPSLNNLKSNNKWGQGCSCLKKIVKKAGNQFLAF